MSNNKSATSVTVDINNELRSNGIRVFANDQAGELSTLSPGNRLTLSTAVSAPPQVLRVQPINSIQLTADGYVSNPRLTIDSQHNYSILINHVPGQNNWDLEFKKSGPQPRNIESSGVQQIKGENEELLSAEQTEPVSITLGQNEPPTVTLGQDEIACGVVGIGMGMVGGHFLFNASPTVWAITMAASVIGGIVWWLIYKLKRK
jgi:hypothetical protein